MSSTRSRFLAGHAAQVGLDVDRYNQPGTTVVGTEDRLGSELAFCYWVGEHAVVWTDPNLTDQLTPLADDTTTLTEAGFVAAVEEAGLLRAASAVQRVRDDGAELPALTELPDRYWFEALSMDDPLLLPRVRGLAEACTPREVEDAALDELDDFNEAAISVLSVLSVDEAEDEPAGGRPLAAYSSACEWDWTPEFADIGVLVHPEHRRSGFGVHVVNRTCRQLLADGLLPMYRHEESNVGSSAIADALGFGVVARLVVHASPAKLAEEGAG